jgi:predicted Zn-dependent protease
MGPHWASLLHPRLPSRCVFRERIVNELFTLNLGREQETEADPMGLLLLQRAKIDPSGMLRFFERLSEKDEERTEWISSHPMSPARAERLKKSSLCYLDRKRYPSRLSGQQYRVGTE